MPTLLRINGFRVVIYTADHEPMHVHVIKDKSIQNALEIVQDNAGMLAEAWETIHGA